MKEIAERLSLSPATVHTHVRNAIAKLEVDTRTEAVALAVRFSYLGAGGPSSPPGPEPLSPLVPPSSKSSAQPLMQ